MNQNQLRDDAEPRSVDQQQACSAATVREALQRCATMDDGWANSAMYDAEKCQQSDHPAIRARADELKSRAENYKLSAARYRSALDWLVGRTVNYADPREDNHKKPIKYDERT